MVPGKAGSDGLSPVSEKKMYSGGSNGLGLAPPLPAPAFVLSSGLPGRFGIVGELAGRRLKSTPPASPWLVTSVLLFARA